MLIYNNLVEPSDILTLKFSFLLFNFDLIPFRNCFNLLELTIQIKNYLEVDK
jgi:hypothetical protein